MFAHCLPFDWFIKRISAFSKTIDVIPLQTTTINDKMTSFFAKKKIQYFILNSKVGIKIKFSSSKVSISTFLCENYTIEHCFLADFPILQKLHTIIKLHFLLQGDYNVEVSTSQEWWRSYEVKWPRWLYVLEDTDAYL